MSDTETLRRESGSRPEHGGKPGKRGRVPAKRLVLLVGVPVAVLVAIGVVGHLRTSADADRTMHEQVNNVPDVSVQEARRQDGPITVTLPGQTQPFDTASIYARATGYVAERRVDIGSRVRKGDLLVRLSAPDTDADLAQAVATVGQLEASITQARANLQQSVANHRLADVTRFRTSTLAGQGWATRQSADNDVANANVHTSTVTSAEAGIAVAEANLRAQQANVVRLQALVDFERVTAPFDGVITSRAVDIGDLLQATASSGTPIFTEDSDDVLRTQVYVPQSEAVGIRDGIDARTTVPEMPGRVFRASVARSAVAIDAQSRSMLTEIDIPNPAHVLRPGLYVNISFEVPRPHPVVVIPDAAVIFDGSGLQVATVADGHARMHRITLGRDFGTTAEVESGLDGGEQVIVSPPADLADGQPVHAPQPTTAHKGEPGQSPPA